MNKVILIGRLTKDPELKFTPGTGTAVATFTLAVDRRVSNKDGQKEADFINVVAWNKAAEIIANYMSKGRMLAVSGRIQTRSYDAKDGTKRYVTEVVADDFQFVDSNKGAAGSGGNNSEGFGNRSSAGSDFGSFNNSNNSSYGEDITPIDDGEIPF
jgi:single-strand DNA-binding protein